MTRLLAIENPSDELYQKAKSRMTELGFNDMSAYLTHLVSIDPVIQRRTSPVPVCDINVNQLAFLWGKNVTADMLKSVTDPEVKYEFSEIYTRVQKDFLKTVLPKYVELPVGVKRGMAKRFPKFESTKTIFNRVGVLGSPNNFYIWK